MRKLHFHEYLFFLKWSISIIFKIEFTLNFIILLKVICIYITFCLSGLFDLMYTIWQFYCEHSCILDGQVGYFILIKFYEIDISNKFPKILFIQGFKK